MKILITGAYGQLGKDITKASQKTEHTILTCGSQDLDISIFHSVLEYILQERPDIIINCAAYNAVDTAESEWEQAFLVNGTGAKNLALAANRVDATLVHYSTDYVFDGGNTRPYTLVDTPAPLSRYGESKLLGEHEVIRHARNYYLIRVSWVFGEGNTNFVKKVLEWSDKQETISIVDDQTASPTYTRDLAQATMDLIATDQYGLYHCTNSGYCSRYEWAQFILKQIDWKGTLTPGKSSDFKTPATRPVFSVLDTFGIPQTIGYNLPSWQDATLRFLKEIGRI